MNRPLTSTSHLMIWRTSIPNVAGQVPHPFRRLAVGVHVHRRGLFQLALGGVGICRLEPLAPRIGALTGRLLEQVRPPENDSAV